MIRKLRKKIKKFYNEWFESSWTNKDWFYLLYAPIVSVLMQIILDIFFSD